MSPGIADSRCSRPSRWPRRPPPSTKVPPSPRRPDAPTASRFNRQRASRLVPFPLTRFPSNYTPQRMRGVSFQSCSKRRQKAIRRCLWMATVQVFLNLPYYALQVRPLPPSTLLQVADEAFSLRGSRRWGKVYLCVDAMFYLLYLSQFPLIYVWVQWLQSDTRSSKRRRKFAPSSSLYLSHEMDVAGRRRGCLQGRPSCALEDNFEGERHGDSWLLPSFPPTSPQSLTPCTYQRGNHKEVPFLKRIHLPRAESAASTASTV